MRPPPPASPLGVRTLAVVAVAVGGSVLALPIVRWVHVVSSILDETEHGAACLVAVTLVLSVVHARLVLRAQTFDQAIGRSLLGGAVAGVLDSGLSLALVSLMEGPDDFWSPIFCFVAGLIGGLGVGMPIGLVLGLAFALPLGLAVAIDKRGARDGADVMATGGGLWLMAMAALAVWIGEEPPWTWPVLASGAALALAGSLRVARLSRWVRGVAAGREAGLAVHAARPDGAAAPLLHTWAIGPVQGVIVHQPTVPPTQSGAYREAALGAQIAYVIEVPRRGVEAEPSAPAPAPRPAEQQHRHDRAAGFRR